MTEASRDCLFWTLVGGFCSAAMPVYLRHATKSSSRSDHSAAPQKKAVRIDFSFMFCSRRLDSQLKFMPRHVTEHVWPKIAKILFP